MDVIVGFDGSSPSLAALRQAATLAERTGKRLVVAHAWDPSLSLPWADLASPDEMDARTGAELEKSTAEALSDLKPEVAFDTLVLRGPAAGALLQQLGAESLLVLGSRGRGGFAGLLLGSVSRECVEFAPCPVLVVRGDRPSDEGPIVVGLDGSAGSFRALEWALAYAEAAGQRVVGAHVWETEVAEVRPAMSDRLRAASEATLNGWVQDVREAVDPVAMEGDPRVELIDLTNRLGASLVVIGRRGAGVIRAMRMGSVASHLLSNCPTAVAVIPLPEPHRGEAEP